jgi:hypothetical protein
MIKYDKTYGELVFLRNQAYKIRITMYNGMDKLVYIPYKVVHGLTIEESLINWWTKGWIMLQNDFEVLERGAVSRDLLQNIEGDISKHIYMFRHDGRNKINIRISTESKDIKDEKLWTMDYDFIIYDVEDVYSDVHVKKFKKLYFIDERYQIFSERNIPWSTSTHGPASKSGTPPWKLVDEQRKMNPCDAIKSIIETASCNTFEGSSKQGELKVGYNYESGSIEKPDIPLNSIKNDLWNSGNPSPEYNVFYTSPANSTVMEDLDFMLNHAVGKYDSPVFLRINRYDKKWELVSLIDYFEKANQIEHLLLDVGLSPSSIVYIQRAPLKKDGQKIINFTSPRASLIKNYKFSQMAPVDDLRFINRPIHTFDFSKGIYNVYGKNNKIEKVYDKMKENCKAGGLYSFSSNSQAQIWMNINKTKREGISTENSFLTQGPTNLNLIRMMKDLIFLNQGLYFQNEGLTLRSPGNFMFVDRYDSSDKNLFDDKFLGQWFITKVIHYFDQNMYLTDVFSSKIDGVTKHWDVLDEKIY